LSIIIRIFLDFEDKIIFLFSNFMKIYPIKLYLKNLFNLITLILSLAINILSWLWLIFQIKPQQEDIFLHYNILFGVDYLGSWWKVFYLPIFGLLILITNNLIGWLLFGKDKFIAQILNAVNLFCQIFIFLAVALLVFLNV